jgi:hypothetical protein
VSTGPSNGPEPMPPFAEPIGGKFGVHARATTITPAGEQAPSGGGIY